MSLGGEGRLLQLESECSNLHKENHALRMKIAGMEATPRRRRSSVAAAMRATRRHHKLRDSYMHTLEDDDSAIHSGPQVSAGKISRQASIGTAQVLREMPCTPRDPIARSLAKRVVAVFREPLRVEHTTYLASRRFAEDLVELSRRSSLILETEPRVLKLESPTYVFGDTHGNLEDLHYFSDHVWRLGVSLTAGSLLFLGDYVDRGLSSLEVVSYLFALKCLEPQKVWLLRGNHETRDVNGWKEHYGERSFLAQCEQRFGEDVGVVVWEAINSAFDRLPLAAIIDEEIFCIHGGFPRRPDVGDLPEDCRGLDRVELLDRVPKVITINPPDAEAPPFLQQLASECIWSDPAHQDQESGLDGGGFGTSLRGGGTVCFGQRAIADFLKETGCAFIIRAHEAHAYGVSLSKSATVFTVFSTSKDHHQGKYASCGCILVDTDKIQVINRSPSYRNRYVHRRDSISLIGVSHVELLKREELGLVIDAEPDDDLAFQDDDLAIDEVDEEEDDDC